MHHASRQPNPHPPLPASFSDALLSPLERKLLRLIRRLIAHDAEVPNNVDLAARLGVRSRQTVAHTLQGLIRIGRIAVELRPAERRIHDRESGLPTRWGPFVRAHAPGSANGSPRRRVARVREGASVIVTSCPPDAGQICVPSPRPDEGLSARRALSCQWPLWADGAVPNGAMCAEPVSRSGKLSFCADHMLRCYPKATVNSPSTPNVTIM